VNSGTYTIEADASITLRPTVSRVPEFMGGGTMSAEYRVVGDTLWYNKIVGHGWAAVLYRRRQPSLDICLANQAARGN
ncbi:MAG: hypothetical protein ACYTAO_20875, partial [Planctomycetota bacterium]